MQQALAAVRHQVRLGRAPVAQRRRPLLRPPQVEDLLAGVDHAAVGDPGHDGRDVAGRDGDHDLVQQRHAPSDLSQPDQRPAMALAGKGHQIMLAETLADRHMERTASGRSR